jgi:hypothetical protein
VRCRLSIVHVVLVPGERAARPWGSGRAGRAPYGASAHRVE